MNTAVAGSYAQVNGIKLYYEIHGSGEPLVLLPGGFMTAAAMGPLVQPLAESRQVIAVELQAHGHTAAGDRPMTFELMADDIAALLDHLGLARADVMGYSLGGGAALQMAIRHPDAVRRLVLLSAPFRTDGWYPEVRAGMAAVTPDAMNGSPMHAEYLRTSPNPDEWPLAIAKIRQLLTGQDYDWTEGVKALRMPVMIVISDADSIPPAHAAAFFALLGGGQKDAGWDGSGRPRSRLAILPGTTHYSIFASPMLPPVVTAFLDAPIPEG